MAIIVNSFLPYRTANDEDESDTLPPSRSTAISPRKRSRSSEDEEASTSLKLVKTSSESGSRMQAQAESSSAMFWRGQKPALIRRSTKGHSHEDSSNSNSDEREKELNAGTSDGLPRSLPFGQPPQQAPVSDQQISHPNEAPNPIAPPEHDLRILIPRTAMQIWIRALNRIRH